MASEPPTEGYGRGMRQARRGQRAKEADLNLTGLQNSSQPATSGDSSTTHKPLSLAPDSQTASNNSAADTTSLEPPNPAATTQTLFSRLNPESMQSDAMSQQVVLSIEDQSQDARHSDAPNAFDSATGNVATQQASSHPPIKQEPSEYRPQEECRLRNATP
jgi:hypothetical protein